jgi:hypothetical protein
MPLQHSFNGKMVSQIQSEMSSKLDTIATNTANIKLSADSVNLNVDEVEAKLDTINTTLTGGIGGLPTSLTGSGNLKVSLQELGNEGSERLNVDVGSTISQLPTALTGAGNLKVHLETMNGSGTGISTSALQGTTNTKLDHLSDNLDTINSSLGDLATESTLQIISEEFTKCDTDNITITGGLTGNGNLKVCIQELGNEGSERLNVDVGDDITQLPTALSGSGRLKIENDISGFSTSANQDTQITHLSEIEDAVETIEACCGSNKVNVNISSGNISGFSTDSSLTSMSAKLPATLGQKANASSMSVCRTSTTGAYDLSARTTIGTASTSTKLLCDTDGHIQADIVASALPSGASTSAKQDATDLILSAIRVEVQLGQTCEDKEVIDDDALSPETLSIAIDTESYDKVRFYGNTTTSSASLGGSDLLVFGSNSSSGTFYHLDQVGSFQASTITISGGSAVHYIGLSCDNVPRYLKIFNKNNSSTFTITKLRMVGSNKMVNV